MALPCVDDSAFITAAKDERESMIISATVETAIHAALALWQRNSSLSVANMQEEIAKRNQRLADYIHDHAKKFWPYEKALVDDAFGVTKAEPQYAALGAQWGAVERDSLRSGRTDWMAELRRRCLAPTRVEAARWDREAARLESDTLSFAARHAEARADALNDMRYQHQSAAVGLGKGIYNNITNFEGLMGAAGMNAARMLGNTINSGLYALGYATTPSAARADGWGAGARQVANAQTVAEAYPVNLSDGITSRPLSSTARMPMPQPRVMITPAVPDEQWPYNREGISV